jgi:hypothetical protein
MAISVYIACKMTGRDKQEMLDRATHVCSVLKLYGITPISPVVEEGVKNEPGNLEQSSKEQLRGFWRRDKHIIRNMAHVVLLDEANRKSTGMEREYGYCRYALWKPVVTLMPNTGFTVADFEDDLVVRTVEEAAELIQRNWGTGWKRFIWRIKMLNRSLPKWVAGQMLAWR